MKPLPLQTIAEFCGGRIVSGDPAATASRVHTDSRTVRSGDIFVALVGERFDAHDFIAQVAQAGAAAVIANRIPSNLAGTGCAVIMVDDTLLALQTLARRYREMMSPLVIGLTGSNGKTTTKDFLAAMMSKRHRVCATVGNLNNHIGVPLTLLSLEAGHTCAVVEMGMNHAGEIAALCEIARPDAAIITNIGVAHIEHLGSREAIAEEKGALAAAVPPRGTIVLNANDSFTGAIRARCRGTVLTAGIGLGDVSATITRSSGEGSQFRLDFGSGTQIDAFLAVPGEHMVINAALAAACAWKHGIPPQEIADALREVKPAKGRLEPKNLRGIIFLDDSYNANPDSMRAGLRTLAGMSVAGRRVAVLGRMGELGAHAAQGYREVGECAAQCGADAVFTVGDEAAQIGTAASAAARAITVENFPSHEACAVRLKHWLREGDAVLLKGSRSAEMERVLSHFEKA